MPDSGDALSLRFLTAIDDVEAAQWDACAGTDQPFTTHDFLSALEQSGSVAGKTGWLPRHIVLSDRDGQLAGCVPLYIKSHSYGEYVFDWGWADAFERAGGRYYPKLQVAVPFTPVTGRRLLVRPDAPPETAETLVRAVVAMAERLDVSSLHVTFPSEAECRLLAAHGFIERHGHQYHWQNRGYASFDDFLGDLASRKRKSIRKERQAVIDSGLAVQTLTGEAIAPRHWDALYRFYVDTVDRKWGHAYLTRRFFDLLGTRMADRVVLVVAENAAGEVVGGALNLLGTDTLYGRYWGCVESYRFLHFEVCYYQAIDFAIAQGLRRVEAGAQGEHKVQRGYLPQRTYSAHWIAEAGFRRAVERFVASERRTIAAEIEALTAESPFRQDRDPP